MLGAKTWQTARRITVPLALPTLLAGALVAFLQALNLFGSPAILAIPAGFHTLTTKHLEPVPVPAQARAGRGRLAAAAAADHRAAARPGAGARPARLCRAGRQVRRSRAWSGSAAGAGRRLALALLVLAMPLFLPYAALFNSAFSRVASRAGHARHLHPAQRALHLPRAQLDHAGAQEHLPAGDPVGDPGRAAGAADRLHRRPPRGARASAARLPRHRAARHPRHRAGRRPVPRLHAPAAHALRHAVDPADRLRHHRAAGGLPAALLGLPCRASRARGGRPHAGRHAAAHAGRHHRAAAALGGDRDLVLRLRRA